MSTFFLFTNPKEVTMSLSWVFLLLFPVSLTWPALLALFFAIASSEKNLSWEEVFRLLILSIRGGFIGGASLGLVVILCATTLGNFGAVAKTDFFISVLQLMILFGSSSGSIMATDGKWGRNATNLPHEKV